MTLQEFRCSKCNKLLGKINGRAEIVCTRCKVLNAFGISSELEKLVDTLESREQYESFRRANTIQIVDELHGYSTKEQALSALKNMDMRVIQDALKVKDAESCSECEQLHEDSETYRCSMFDDAIIEDTTEKHCKDSIR